MLKFLRQHLIGLHPSLVALIVVGCLPAANGVEPVDFNRDISPILSENCLYCHGPDANHREADLRLDTAEGAKGVINSEHPDQSELMVRVLTDDPETQMPPPASKRQLTPQQKELLKRWLAEGAKWGAHWSFAAIQSPPVPQTEPAAAGVFVRNPIDAFIQFQLRRQTLTPSIEADRRTLLRRLSLDLTGLPPTPEEVEAYLQDQSDDAYEKQVERLLNSPAYGERMAWDWLDAARYADSNGYQGDRERTMWPWRDWVIRAFNENLPYDQFTVWQLAGDQLPDATFEQRLATGFCRNHMINGEGGRIAEENRVDYVMDMTETMGTIWLGLTLNCCRCHDHKFDPLTRNDYYGLFAYFNQTPVNGGGGDPQTPPVLDAPTSEQQSRMQSLEAELAAVREQQKQRTEELSPLQAEWEATRAAELLSQDVWSPINIASAKAEHQKLEIQPDGVVFASGPNPDNDTYTLAASTPVTEVRSIRLEALKHPSHTAGGLARSDSGNFVLTEFEISIRRNGSETAEPVVIQSAKATFEQGDLKVERTFDGKPNTGWAVHEGKPVDREHAANFSLTEPLQLHEGDQLQFVLRHDSPHKSHNLGRFRLLLSSQQVDSLERPLADFAAALKVPVGERTADQKKIVHEAFLKADGPYQQFETRLADLQKQKSDLQKSLAKVMVMQDMDQLRETFMLERGLYNQPGDPVTMHTPASLPPLPEGIAANRLALAQWLVSNDHPLTARVTVNRFWQQVFGTGLVKTTEDFGVQGEVPAQLDLLNWLADDFRSHGWDVKRLMRLMVTSHTYRQSSHVTQEHLELDPANRFYARAPRYRIPFWMVRDQALAASGLLVRTQGGPSVNGYQPEGIWEEATFGNKRYSQDHGDALYRRSLYTFWRRIIAPTMFFDSATRQTCNVKLARTNTPLQALLTLNDVTYIEAARHLAESLLKNVDATEEQRLNTLYQRLLGRPIQSSETAILLAALDRSRTHFTAQPEAAAELLKQGEAPRDESVPTIDHAAWTALCLAVMNLDETLTKE